MRRFLFLTGLFLLLTACGGKSPAAPAVTPPEPTFTRAAPAWTATASPAIPAVSPSPTLPLPPPPTSSPTPESFSWEDASALVGQRVTVCGPVVGAHYAQSSNGAPTFLNVGRDYPDPQRLVLLIWGDDRADFPAPPEEHYLGKEVCARGEVRAYKGVPEIEITDPGQIVVQP